jgi:hypothetical protein
MSMSKQDVALHIRRALRVRGIKVGANELALIERRGEKLKCTFVFGSPLPSFED